MQLRPTQMQLGMLTGLLVATACLRAWGLPSAADWGGFRDGSRFAHRATSATGENSAHEFDRQDSLHAWDALSYEVALALEFNPAQLEATVRVMLVAREPLNWLDLHLRGYEIHSARINGQPVAWSREEDRLLLDLSTQPVAAGDSLLAELQYSGPPVVHAGTGLFVAPQIAYTLSDPWGTRNWIACFDEPHDKALWRVSVRADSSFSTLSNGVLESIQPHGDGTGTWSYRHDRPMSSYLVSIVCGRLSILEDEWQGLPLRWFVNPQHVGAAEQAVSRMAQMLECFSGLWGDYPFEGYAMGEAPIYGGMGGMEHQTCTTIGNGIIAAGLQYESIIAHELSHMWWGDALTPVDFRQVWLNEGWATYAEALYFQHLAAGDETVFLDYLQEIQQTYLSWDSEYLPIFAPPADDLFNISQYEKAASVLHMLRDLLGDAAFAQAQRDWQTDHSYGTVSTAEYQAALENAGNQELDWFFQQWIYSGGYPTYQHRTELRQQADECLVHLTVSQSHPRLDSFRARVPLRLVSSLATLDTLVWLELPTQQFSWTLPGVFDTLIFNHRHPVLCRQQALPPQPGPPQWRVLALELDDSQGGNGDGDLAQGESAWLSLQLENTGGWDTDVQFSLSGSGVEIGGTWDAIPETGGGMVHDLPLGQVQLAGLESAAAGYLNLTLGSRSAQYPEQQTMLQLPVGDPWLLVVAAGSQSALLPFYREQLDSLRVFSDVLDPLLTPLPETLRPDHHSLIWLTGASGQSLSSAQAQWLAARENEQTGLLICGQDAFDPLDPPFLDRIEILNPDVNEVLVDGEGELAGLSALLIGAGGAQNQTSPSSLTCPNGSCLVLARYRNSQEPAMLLLDWQASSHRVITAGFGLEAISGMAGTSSRRDWLGRLAPLLDVEVSVAPGPPAATQPGGLVLGDAQPNPFNPTTTLFYQLDRPQEVSLQVHDLLGRQVARSSEGRRAAGIHQLRVDGSGLAAGLYLVTVQAGGQRATRKVLLLK